MSIANSDDGTSWPLPLARHHSYLQGALLPVSTRTSSRRDTQRVEPDTDPPARPSPPAPTAPRSRLQELPVLELDDIVLFPGATIPIRWCNDSMSARSNWNRLVATSPTPRPIRMGVLCTNTEAQRHNRARHSSRRESWTRQGHGPQRLRRYSQQLVAELGHDVSYRDDDAAASNNPAPRRTNDRATTEATARSYIGRIGTVATVMFLHESMDDTDQQDGSTDTTPVTAVTAVGTMRFEIVAYRTPDEQRDYHSNDHLGLHYQRRGGMDELKYFVVEEIHENTLVGPLTRLQYCAPTHPCEQQMRYVSTVSPHLPLYVLRRLWPWRLVALMRQSLQSPALSGLKESTCRDGVDTASSLDPVAFSFWLAANLPLSLDEKLRLLQVRSTVERLLILRDKLASLSPLRNTTSTEPTHQSTTSELWIHCRQCLTPMARAHHIFTVDGAEGTSGNYVNAHGVVHQTITLRHVGEDDVWFQGGPETQDSWFPGYSWTIMVCGFCRHHLGWKFCLVPTMALEQIVDASRPVPVLCATPDRPTVFYGLSAANVDMLVPT